MDEKEAIKRIKECRNTPNFQPYRYINEALDMAIKALEKQIPKKPVLVDRPFACVKVRVCSSCSIPENYYPLFSKVNYCTNCGQKLDWSVNNEID